VQLQRFDAATCKLLLSRMVLCQLVHAGTLNFPGACFSVDCSSAVVSRYEVDKLC